MFVRLIPLVITVGLVWPLLASTDAKVEAVDKQIPGVVSSDVKSVLNPSGFAVSIDGEFSAIFWFQNEASENASDSSELGVTFGSLGQGRLVGLAQFNQPWSDYKENQIPPGTYTMRYGIMPADGNHMGVSTYRDFLLLIPASEDPGPSVALEYSELVNASVGAAGVPHPAVLALFPIWEEISEPLLVKNELDQWTLAVKLGSKIVGLVLLGHGET